MKRQALVERMTLEDKVAFCSGDNVSSNGSALARYLAWTVTLPAPLCSVSSILSTARS